MSHNNCATQVIMPPSFDMAALFNTTNAMKENRRKRRRGEVANPANTLDALVAKKADDQPFEKRFLSEQEAIDGPDDEMEMKKMEHDPDVSTRTCSTCGYQGKWVSEMIRHKRVHTSERPFKCRYCSRTSKWKADLIRHVKPHGIRVVSKYSRSKTFDSKEENEIESKTSPCSIEMPKPQYMLYRCVTCGFEDCRVSVVNSHIASSHQAAPYECRCGMTFNDIQTAVFHSNANSLTCELNLNIMPSYKATTSTASSLSPCTSEVSYDSGVNSDLPSPTTNFTPIPMAPEPLEVHQLIATQLSNLYLAQLQSLITSSLLSQTFSPTTSTVIEPPWNISMLRCDFL